MLKHNTYFEGAVQSIGFERNGRRMTMGVIAPGQFHFGTDAPERMTIVSGEVEVKTGDTWRSYPQGTTFEIEGKSGFDIRASLAASYLCEFL